MSNATNAITYLITQASIAVQEDPSDENKAILQKLKAIANDPETLKSLEQELSQ